MRRVARFPRGKASRPEGFAGCFCLMAALHAAFSQAQAPSQQEFSCSQGQATRIVSVVTVPPSDGQPRGSCRVDYIKDRVTKTLWSSNTGHAYCLKKATAFVTKLAEVHYSCSLKTKEPPER
jgi:hypothetical protein